MKNIYQVGRKLTAI